MIKERIKIKLKNKHNIAVVMYLLYFLIMIFQYTIQYSMHEIMKDGSIFLFVVGIVILGSNIIEITVVRGFLRRYQRWINIPVLLASAVVSFVIIEIMVSNYNIEMFKHYSFYNNIWYLVIYLLCFTFIRKVKLAVKLANILIYLIAVVNYLVYAFRGNPILPSDMLAWKTGMSVASNYSFNITKGFMIATILMLFVYTLANKLEEDITKISIVNRICGFGVYILFATSVFTVFFRTDIIKSTISVLDFFAPKYTYSSYGTVFGFVANVDALIVKRPEGYSVEQVKSEFQNIKEEPLPAETKPNVIVIMNEAFSDLSMVGDFKTNMEYLPYTNALKENTIKGKLYVSVYGGATSDTEYEFLTGNSMAVMPRNSVPYQQFITQKMDSLASTLKAQGYYNIAIHPYHGSGYKRDIVYPLLGFDEFLSMEDFQDPELIRSFISDRESYHKIIKEYEEKGDDQPLFLFNVTMQNHGGYSGNTLFSDADNVKLTEQPGHPDVEQYLSLLRQSDMDFQILTDYFSKQKEPTIILLYGDHQPVVYSDFHNEIEKESPNEINQKKYAVPFFIWANYDIKETEIDKISANYLSSYLLQTAGIPGTEYNSYLMDLYKKIPVINALFYIDQEDNCYNIEEQTQYSGFITKYQYIGYNNVFDKKHRLDHIFSLKTK